MTEENQPNSPKEDFNSDEAAKLERDLLELKLRAEFGAKEVFSSGELPPEIQEAFLRQVYDFEKAYAGREGEAPKFGDSFNPQELPPWPGEGAGWEEKEAVVEEICKQFESRGILVNFSGDYPPKLKYDFLSKQLPGLPDHFGGLGAPGMMRGVIYEEYFPNLGEDLEICGNEFLAAFFSKDIKALKSTLSRGQFDPQSGPYDGMLLLDYLRHFFETTGEFIRHKYSIMQVSYERTVEEEEAPGREEASGQTIEALGYVEGLVGYEIQSLLQAEPIKHVGPFKMYTEYKWGYWAIMLPSFPGIPIPPPPVG